MQTAFSAGSIFGTSFARVSMGLVALLVMFYAWHLVHVVSMAAAATSQSNSTGAIVLLGKHAPNARIDADFRARIDRVQVLLNESPLRTTLLSGGGEGKSEALVAWEALRGGPEKELWLLETKSGSTWQNLSNTQRMLPASGNPVSIVSSRYHLARIDHLARSLRFPVELVAAESVLAWDMASCIVLMREAAYLSLLTASGR